MAAIRKKTGDKAGLSREAGMSIEDITAVLPEDLEKMSPEEVRQSLHELRAYNIGLETQLDGLRRAKDELDARHAHCLDLYDCAPAGYLTINDKGLVIESNLTATRLLGVQREALVKASLAGFILNEDRDIYSKLSRRLFETGEPQSCEMRLEKSDGTIFWALVETAAARDENGTAECRMALSDITERKQAELELASEQKKLHRLSNIGIWEWDVRNNSVTWSEELYKIAGFDPSFPPPSFAEHERIFTADSWERLSKAVAVALDTGRPYNLELELIRPDGGMRWINAFGGVRPDANGKIAGLRGTLQDITWRKQTEKALRNSENKFYKAFSASPDVLIISRRDDGLIVETNLSMERLLGYSREEVIWRSSLELGLFANPADRLNVVAQLQEQGSIRDYEVQVRCKSGEVLKTFLSAEPIEIDSKPYILTMIHDITKLKETERQLQIKNRMLVSINDYTQAIVSAEPGQLYKTIVAKLKEITGAAEVFINDYDWEHSDLIFRQSTLSEESNTWLMKKLGNRLVNLRSPVSKKQYEIIMKEPVGRVGSLHEITFGAIPAKVGRVIEKAFGFGWFVATVLKHDNKMVGTLMIAGKKGQIQPGNEELIAYAGATANVLARRTAEIAMNESEARYRLLSEHTTDTVWMVDMDLNMTYHSPSGEKLRGFTVREIMEMPLDRQFSPESFKLLSELISEELPKVLADRNYNPFFTLDLEYSCKDGSNVWSESKFSVIRDESGKPVAILGEGRDVTERKKTEEALIKSEHRLLEAQRIAHVGNWEWNLRTGEASWSPEIYSMHGMSQDSPTLSSETFIRYVHPDDKEKVNAAISQAISEGRPADLDYRIVRADGSIRVIHVVGNVTEFDAEGRPLMMLGTKQDITDRKRTEDEHQRLQDQLLQAQKMESVGRLAGGVAHDFNNMLSVIIGHADLLMSQIQPEGPAYNHLKEIEQAGERSAELTKQLLTFARRQVIAPVVLDMNDNISGILKMLTRLIGENIRLSWKPAANLWPVKMDPTQINQILANLVVNSRDAIGDSGNIIIETSNVEIDSASIDLYQELAPGNYILLAVSDDGCGMDNETRAQIFEPFFTTKEMGKGTGLGLATVYGIVKQNSGFINVYSETGKGTTFKIYLPASGSDKPEVEKSDTAVAPAGTETILLVEDEEAVLYVYKTMLEKLGYKVLSANSPAEAVELAGNYEDDIPLLLTDVLMPGTSGSYLWKKLSSERIKMKCLFMSGYTFDIISKHGILDEGVNYLQKPFSIDILARKIREVLEG